MSLGGAKENGSAAKIAFLALFALSLALARGIVALRSAVVLGEPIPLKHAGLSVRLPQGRGWHSEQRWDYSGNSFVLSSILPGRGSEAVGIVRCRYFVAARAQGTGELFLRRAARARGRLVQTGRLEAAGLTFEWAHISSRNGRTNIYCGVALLAGNRQLEIEVIDYAGKAQTARRVFEQVVGTVELAEDSVLAAGARLVEKMREKGLSSFFDGRKRRVFSLIKDAREQALGFTVDAFFAETRQAGAPRINLVSFLYSRGLSVREYVASLQTDERFERFTLRSKGLGGQTSGAEVEVDQAGVVTVRRLGGARDQASWRLSAAMVPAMLLEQLLQVFVEIRPKEIVVDVLETDGGITPTYISMADPNGPGAGKGGSYRLQLLPLGGAEAVELVYLDQNKQIFRSVRRGRQIYIFETAGPEEVALLFPERAELIRDPTKLGGYLD